MRKVKILELCFICILFVLVIYSCSEESNNSIHKIEINEVQGRSSENLIDLLGTACVPNSINIGLGCNDTIFIDTLVVTDHPIYPGCTFKIIFNRQECKLGNVDEDVTIGDFQILEHNCQQFSIDIGNNYNQSIWSNYIINFETGMWEIIKNYIVSQKITGDKYKCGEGLFFQINFIRASCYRYASMRQKTGLGISVKLSCGSHCCERHALICRDADGSIKENQYDVTDPISGDCDNPAFLTNPPIWLEGRIEWLTACTLSCPE